MTEKKNKEIQYHIITKRVNGGSMNCFLNAENLSDALDQEINWNSRGRNNIAHVESIEIQAPKEDPPC